MDDTLISTYKRYFIELLNHVKKNIAKPFGHTRERKRKQFSLPRYVLR